MTATITASRGTQASSPAQRLLSEIGMMRTELGVAEPGERTCATDHTPWTIRPQSVIAADERAVHVEREGVNPPCCGAESLASECPGAAQCAQRDCNALQE